MPRRSASATEERVLLLRVGIDGDAGRRVDLHGLLLRGDGGGQIVDRRGVLDLARQELLRGARQAGLLQSAEDLLLLLRIDAPVGGGSGDHGADQQRRVVVGDGGGLEARAFRRSQQRLLLRLPLPPSAAGWPCW